MVSEVICGTAAGIKGKVRRVSLGDLIVESTSGFPCNKSKLVTNGLPHLRPFNIGEEGRLVLNDVYHVSPDVASTGKDRLLEGDILFNNTNSAELVGKSALVEKDMVAGFSNHITRIRIDQSLAEPAWVNFALMKYYQDRYFSAHATRWVSQAGFKIGDLSKLEIPLPDISEQRRIVDILNRADSIRRLRKQAIDTARQLIPALFIDMFGDPATNPKGWVVKSLREVADIGSGVTRGRNPIFRLDSPNFGF